MDKLEIYIKDIERYDFYIEKADNKASFLLAFEGIVLTLITPLANDFLRNIDSSIIKNTVMILLVIALIAIVVAAVSSALVIFPRFSKITGTSVLYYNDVKDLKSTELIERISNLKEEQMLNDFAEQVVVLAKISSKKMVGIRWSLGFLGIAGIFIVAISLLSILCS